MDKFKDSGVKWLFLEAVVPETPENNHDQCQLIHAMGIEGLEWRSTTSLKMALVLVGKSLGQFTYICPFFDMSKPDIDKLYKLTSLNDLQQLHQA